MAAATVARMAMNPGILGKIGNFLNPGTMSNLDKALRFGPDVVFGGLAAAQTPGDIVDKSIAFAGTAGGGLLGGLGSAGLVRHYGKNSKMAPEALQSAMGMADMFGSMGGDMAGYPLSEAVARLKDSAVGGKGETGWERMSRQQQEAMRKEMEASVLQQYGIVPGTRNDDYLATLGLA